jgi:processing peptidase subunit beta
MIQMSGGDMQMDYNQESMYFKGHCIEYDTIDMFQMMVDIALEPRSVLAANVAKSKNAKSHSLHEHLIKCGVETPTLPNSLDRKDEQ